MKTQSASVQNPTVSTRPGKQRSGSLHTYVLNGATFTDRLIDGQWVTVKVC
ncbi:hypothetical protein [Paraburkholderia youngii]|uniref:hypothetical protein n=1 Tax=Paraburkholderia youngii TaxID=2782701 RepID=UPI003D195CE9